MDLSKAFATNATKELEGVWVKLDDTASIKVARAGNTEFKEYYNRLQKQHAAGPRREVPEGMLEQLLIKATARCLLRDWKGLEMNGKPLPPYTEAEGIRVLTELKDFREYVFATAMNTQQYQDLDEEADAKNS